MSAQTKIQAKPANLNPLTLANQITILRLLLTPVILICLFSDKTKGAIYLLIFSILTDFFDGFVARLKKEQSLLGAFLDPLADKLMVTSVFLVLAVLKIVEMWVFVVIFSRDLLIVLGWVIIFILTQSSRITPRFLGKLTTAVQMVASVVFIAGVAGIWKTGLIWITVGFSIASAIEYIIIGEGRLGQWN